MLEISNIIFKFISKGLCLLSSNQGKYFIENSRKSAIGYGYQVASLLKKNNKAANQLLLLDLNPESRARGSEQKSERGKQSSFKSDFEYIHFYNLKLSINAS